MPQRTHCSAHGSLIRYSRPLLPASGSGSKARFERARALQRRVADQPADDRIVNCANDWGQASAHRPLGSSLTTTPDREQPFVAVRIPPPRDGAPATLAGLQSAAPSATCPVVDSFDPHAFRQDRDGGSLVSDPDRACKAPPSCSKDALVSSSQSLLRGPILSVAVSCLLGCATLHPITPSTTGHHPQPASPEEEEHPDLLNSELGWNGPPAGDCDENGIPDSLDIARRYADDLNHNHELDTCELYYIPGGFDSRDSRWEDVAVQADTLALFRSFAKHVGIAIQCYVPSGSRPAQLLVRNNSGVNLATIADSLSSGPHWTSWGLRNSAGHLVTRGVEYVICLEQGGRSIQRTVCWRREVHF